MSSLFRKQFTVGGIGRKERKRSMFKCYWIDLKSFHEGANLLQKSIQSRC